MLYVQYVQFVTSLLVCKKVGTKVFLPPLIDLVVVVVVVVVGCCSITGPKTRRSKQFHCVSSLFHEAIAIYQALH